ncbi:MAG: nitrophenyl compound nitroreductase subunit ArsF family protein [Patescibacteria group bacterium]|jgi:hypothetical protein|nr:nitrophenyl compound nitroreductase subunit ArsF family protein [Patescibacteria group bacterium]
MKKSLVIQLSIFAIVAIVLIVIGSSNGSSSSISKAESSKEDQPKADKIEMYYFHTTARCASCQTLEKYVEETINQYFQDEVNKGIIDYKVINVDKPENKEVANKYKATGSSLFLNIIYNDKDHILQDSNVWRYLSNKQQFKTYLSNKINGYFK